MRLDRQVGIRSSLVGIGWVVLAAAALSGTALVLAWVLSSGVR
jgi:hypothetical protein